MIEARHPLVEGQQRGVLVAGPGRIPRPPGPIGEVAPDGQGVRVLGAEDLLSQGQQRCQLLTGPSYIPRCPGPVGELAAGDQGRRMLRPEVPLPSLNQPFPEFTGRGIAPAVPQISGDPFHAVTARGQRCLGMRQQRGEHRPAILLLRIIGDRGLYYCGGGLPPRLGQPGGHLIGGDRLHQPMYRHHPV